MASVAPLYAALFRHRELGPQDIADSFNRGLYLPSGHTTTNPVGWSAVARARRGFLVAGFASADTRLALRGFGFVPVASNKNCWRHGSNPSLGAEPRSLRLWGFRFALSLSFCKAFTA